MSLTRKRLKQLADALREAAQHAPTDELRDVYLDIADLKRVDGIPSRVAKRLLDTRCTVTQIADAFGCGENTVRRWMKQNNLTLRKPNK